MSQHRYPLRHSISSQNLPLASDNTEGKSLNQIANEFMRNHDAALKASKMSASRKNSQDLSDQETEMKEEETPKKEDLRRGMHSNFLAEPNDGSIAGNFLAEPSGGLKASNFDVSDSPMQIPSATDSLMRHSLISELTASISTPLIEALKEITQSFTAQVAEIRSELRLTNQNLDSVKASIGVDSHVLSVLKTVTESQSALTQVQEQLATNMNLYKEGFEKTTAALGKSVEYLANQIYSTGFEQEGEAPFSSDHQIIEETEKPEIVSEVPEPPNKATNNFQANLEHSTYGQSSQLPPLVTLAGRNRDNPPQSPPPPTPGSSIFDLENFERVVSTLSKGIGCSIAETILANQNQNSHSQYSGKPVSISKNDLPQFNGAVPSKLPKFLSDFNIAKELAKWQDHEALFLLKGCLTEYARDVFESAPDGTCDTLSKAIDFLKSHFLKGTDQQSAMTRLYSCKQKPNQSVLEYYSEILDLSRTALASFGENEKNATLRTTFIGGLRSARLREHVDRRQPKDLTEAMNFAATEQERLNMRDESRIYGNNSDTNHVRQSNNRGNTYRGNFSNRGYVFNNRGYNRGRIQFPYFPNFGYNQGNFSQQAGDSTNRNSPGYNSNQNPGNLNSNQNPNRGSYSNRSRGENFRGRNNYRGNTRGANNAQNQNSGNQTAPGAATGNSPGVNPNVNATQ